jgi:hypothetical protein
MSHHYAYHRDFTAKNWIKNFVVFMIFAYYACNVAFMLPFYAFGETPNHAGKMIDLWSTGLMIYLLCVFYTHALFLTYIRNFNLPFLICLGVVYIQWIIVFAVV